MMQRKQKIHHGDTESRRKEKTNDFLRVSVVDFRPIFFTPLEARARIPMRENDVQRDNFAPTYCLQASYLRGRTWDGSPMGSFPG